MIYSYVSFLMRLIEIIKTLILLFTLLHLYGVAITRLAEGCTPLVWPQLLLLLRVVLTALKLKIDKKRESPDFRSPEVCISGFPVVQLIVGT